MIRTLLVSAFLLAYVPPACLIGWGLAWWQGSDRPLYQIGRFGVRMALRIAGVQVEVSGADRLHESANTIVMPNHLSNLDAPVLFTVLPPNFKVVAKKELFRIPFLASTFRMARFVELDRRRRDEARRAMQKSVESLRDGDCFLIFPEGTRSESGALGEFKKGGFLVALEAGSRVVPVAVTGTRELMPKGGFRIEPGTVRVVVLPPVEARGYRVLTRDALVAAVRGRIAEALAS